MSGRVIVIGAGIAGVAAAWSARNAGHDVTLVSSGAGASALGSGAVDDVPWEELLHAARLLGGGLPQEAPALASSCLAFAADLGLWDLPALERAWIATVAGRIRPARGRDRALLDLAPLHDVRVLVPRVERAAWDADALAAALARSPFARARRLAFHAVDLPVLRFDDEHRAGDVDLAMRHDDEARIAWLADRLREGLTDGAGAGAILLGPWLGALAPRAASLSAAVGVPCGEALAGTGSPAGLRFEAARDRLLETLGVRRVRDRALRVDGNDEGRPGPFVVKLARGEPRLEADAVVLALGGLVGGGVIYAPPERGAQRELAPGGKVPFELSLEAPVVLSKDDAERMGIIASMHGPELDVGTWRAGASPGGLEGVGIRCEGTLAAPGLHAAGDVVAGRGRTVLEAVSSGLAAGAASCFSQT